MLRQSCVSQHQGLLVNIRQRLDPLTIVVQFFPAYQTVFPIGVDWLHAPRELGVFRQEERLRNYLKYRFWMWGER